MTAPKKPKQNSNTISKIDSETRLNDLYEALLDGVPKKELQKKFEAKWKVGPSGFRKIYDKAMSRIKEDFHGNVEQIRAGVVTDMLVDIKTAFKNYEKYDGQPDVKSNELAQKWFNTYINLKKEYVEYFPGVKPKTQVEEKDMPDIIFLADDGVDDPIEADFKQIEQKPEEAEHE